MNLLKNIYSELLGLFVDDGALALWSIFLVAIVTVFVKILGLPPLWAAALLVLGCVAILSESVMRAARRDSE